MMKSAVDIYQDILILLSLNELDAVLKQCAQVAGKLLAPQELAILVWDSDLETFQEYQYLSNQSENLINLVSKFKQTFDSETFDDCQDIGNLGKELYNNATIFAVKLSLANELCAVLLLVNPEKTNSNEIRNHTKVQPFGTAIYKAREVNELKQDIRRLREEIERAEESLEKYKSHEPRLTETEYEKQFYQLSNKLRGCINVQELFPLVAREIGQTNRVSRCLLIQLLSSGDSVEVFEYHHPHTEPAANLFNTEEGITFTKAAMASHAPQQLFDPDTETGGTYSSDFLRKLGLKSGLILPIITRNTTLGIIFLNQCHAAQEWGIGDTARLGTLADLVAVSIENALLHAKIEKLSVTDGLTGIANRRKFDEKFQEEFDRAKRYQEPLSILVFDLDYLKKINDTYGHPTGDEAIKAIGLVLDQSSRSIDLAARFGGEEFCLLLPNTDLEMATQIGDRIREKINKVEIGGPGQISVSVGVAALTNNEDNPQQLFHRADQALYKAKQNGRNQVCQG